MGYVDPEPRLSEKREGRPPAPRPVSSGRGAPPPRPGANPNPGPDKRNADRRAGAPGQTKPAKLSWGFRAMRTWLVLLAFLAVIGGAVFLWMKMAPLNREQSQAEALANVRTSMGGELSSFERLMNRKSRLKMDNASVLRLVNANVSSAIIVQLIRASSTDFDLSSAAIVELKNAGVPESVMMAMVDTAYKTQ